MVTKRARLGSATVEFLRRMEERRINQECMLTLDMRGKVAYECSSYQYRNRTFWMDDISYGIFLRGLEENNGVFTVGVSEQILGGEHTLKAVRERRNVGHPTTVGSRAGDAVSAGAHGSTTHNAVNADAWTPAFDELRPEVWPLGYYRDRLYPRLQYSTRISLNVDGQALALTTVDLSASGIRVAAKHPLHLHIGQTVAVTFTGFNDEYQVALNDIGYRVLGTEVNGYQFRARLMRLADVIPDDDFIARYVETAMSNAIRRRKADYEDDRLTACSLLAEQYYTLGSTLVPFFIRRENTGLCLSMVAKNENSSHFLSAFSVSEHRYDLRSLAAPHRVAELYQRCQENGQDAHLIAVFRNAEGAPRVIADFEFPSEPDWFAFVGARCSDKQFYVYRVFLRSVIHPDRRKTVDKVERLQQRSSDQAEIIVRESGNTEITGVLVDITAQIRAWGYASAAFNDELVRSALSVAEKNGEALGKQPMLVPFGYQEQRHEDRYIAVLAVNVQLHGKSYPGATRDISVRGFCIDLDATNTGVVRGDVIGVSLPTLHKRARKTVRLKNIPCEVVGVEESESKTRIALKRVLDQNSRAVSDFIRDLIERNVDRIAPDLIDVVTAARSRLFASLAAESAATVPLLILKEPETGDRIVKVALPKDPSAFARFFEVTPNEYDFSAIADPARIAPLTVDLRKNTSAEIVVYLYKKPASSGAPFAIVASSEDEFQNRRERQEFIAEAFHHEHCFVKIVAAAVREPSDSELREVLESLMARAPLRATKLQAEFSRVAAVGDMIDITRDVMDAEALAGGAFEY